ncbi:MAG: hypothetical protein AAF828_11495 [Bacteroidota bacterium]
MPDKQTNWSADDVFWDEAWQDMHRQLDQAMPIKEKRRKRAIFWWWTGIAVLLLAGMLVSQSALFSPAIDSFPLPSVQQETTQVQTPILAAQPATPERPTLSDASVSTITQTESPPTLPAASTDLAATHLTATLSTIKENTSFSKQSLAAAAVPPVPVTGTTDAPTSPDQQVSGQGAVVGDVSSMASVALLPTKSLSFLPLSPALQLPSEAQKLKRRKKTNILAEVMATHGSRSPGSGYGFGLVVQRSLHPRHSLSLSFGVRAQREQYRFGRFENGRQESDEAIFSGMDTSIANLDDQLTFGDLNAIAAEQGADYLTSYDLRIGINYDYSLGKRWFVGGGLGLNYLVRGRAPSLIAQVQGTPTEERSGSFLITDFGFQNLLSANATTTLTSSPGNNEPFSTNRLRFDWELRLGYRFSPRLDITAGCRNFTTPLLNTDLLKVNTLRGEVGIRYRFGRQ